jgi:hypothetical protein
MKQKNQRDEKMLLSYHSMKSKSPIFDIRRLGFREINMVFDLKLADHLAAYVRTAAACLGTLPAVVMIMLLAFFGACQTCLDAQLAYFLNEGAVA